jgi:hypothetical protein
MMFPTAGVSGWARAVSQACGRARRPQETSSWTADALEAGPRFGAGCDWRRAIEDVLGETKRSEGEAAMPERTASCAPQQPVPAAVPEPVDSPVPGRQQAPGRVTLPEAGCDAVKPILSRFAPKPEPAPRVRKETPSPEKAAKSKGDTATPPEFERRRKPAAAVPVAEQPVEPCQRAAASRVTASFAAASTAAEPKVRSEARLGTVSSEIEGAFRRRLDGAAVPREVLDAAIARAARQLPENAGRANVPRAKEPPPAARTERVRETSERQPPAERFAAAEGPQPLYPVGVATRATSPAPDMQINSATDVAGSVTRVSPPSGVPAPPPLVSSTIATPPAIGLVAPLTRLATQPEDVEAEEEDLTVLAGQIQEILRREARRHGIHL